MRRLSVLSETRGRKESASWIAFWRGKRGPLFACSCSSASCWPAARVRRPRPTRSSDAPPFHPLRRGPRPGEPPILVIKLLPATPGQALTRDRRLRHGSRRRLRLRRASRRMFLCRPRRPPCPRLRQWSRREPDVTCRQPPIRLRAPRQPDVMPRPLRILPQVYRLRRPRRCTLLRMATSTSAARRCPVRLVRRQRRRQAGRRPRCQTALPDP